MNDGETTMIQELVLELRVRDVMRRNIIEVSPSTTMTELRSILKDNSISGAPVTTEGRLIGVISLDNFIHWLTSKSDEGVASYVDACAVRTAAAEELALPVRLAAVADGECCDRQPHSLSLAARSGASDLPCGHVPSAHGLACLLH